MIRRTLLVGAGAAALAGLAACGGGPDTASSGAHRTIVFSILSTESAQDQKFDWAAFLDDMSGQTGLTIKPFFASSDFALVQAMAAGRTDVGWFSNKAALTAVERGHGEVFVHPTDPSGAEGRFAYIIVPAGSGTTLDDILRCDKTLSFAMGDAQSTSGTLAPMTYLFGPHGIDPERCFKTLRSAGHEANLDAVANGLIDAAASNSTTLRLKPEAGARVRVVWRSPPLPQDPVVWRKDLDPSVKEKIRSFFLTYGTKPGPDGDRERAVLARLSFARFEAADDSHLLPVREMEATRDLIQARDEEDAAGVRKAQAALDRIHAEQTRVGAATVAPAPAAAPVDP
jgi:phosphonate transport system substrate-binding protein